MVRTVLTVPAFVLALAVLPASATVPPDKASNSTGEAVIKNCSTICIPFLGNAFVYCIADAREQLHLRQVVWTDPHGRDVLPWAPERHAFVFGNSFLSHSYLVFQDFNATIAGTYWCSVLVNGSFAGRASIRILVSSSNETTSVQCQCELQALPRSVRRTEEKCQLESTAQRDPDKLVEKVCQPSSFRVSEHECRLPRQCQPEFQRRLAEGVRKSSQLMARCSPHAAVYLEREIKTN